MLPFLLFTRHPYWLHHMTQPFTLHRDIYKSWQTEEASHKEKNPPIWDHFAIFSFPAFH